MGMITIILMGVCVTLLIIILVMTASGKSGQSEAAKAQDKRLEDVFQMQNMSMQSQDNRLSEFSKNINNLNTQNEQKLENIRQTMEKRIAGLQEENKKQLEEMRNVVDEKLQKTLEERISKSFQLVSDRLEQVYKGLGEMQNLASGVGDLKKVLSNVKTRGILGEIQLGAILKEMLSPEQYEENICTKKRGGERVEFAVKLPGDDEKEVYLPIDAKFPMDRYHVLTEAYESANKEAITAATKELERAVKASAKDISEKYIEPPHTTDFGIMFLPVEGLYAEVVKMGMVETLQKDHKIIIAGPTTMAALLNSLQMGFKTLAIQKHSSEVWEILAAVKNEFEKFGGVLAKTQEKLDQANKELDLLVGVRTRKINSKLNKIQKLNQVKDTEVKPPELIFEDIDFDTDEQE